MAYIILQDMGVGSGRKWVCIGFREIRLICPTCREYNQHPPGRAETGNKARIIDTTVQDVVGLGCFRPYDGITKAEITKAETMNDLTFEHPDRRITHNAMNK